MENNQFKSVAFGGFDKQDVIGYIEKTSREAAEVQEQLQKENDDLRRELQEVRQQSGEARSRVEELEREIARLQGELERESGLRRELESRRQELERLGAQAESLRSDAAAYARFREQIGAIECEARQRAAELEDESAAKMRQALARFQEQYRTLMSTFESTAAHVNGELRKIEVSLTQLPRAMDQPGKELKELEALLEGRGEGEN